MPHGIRHFSNFSSELRIPAATATVNKIERRIEQRMNGLSVDSDLGLQQDVARGVAEHDLVGAGDDLPAVAEDIPVGE